MRIFSIYDTKAKFFTQTIAEKNSASAERNFKTAVNTDGTDFKRYPEDYELYELASFDNETGIVSPHSKPLLICSAAQLVQIQDQ